MGNQTGYNPEPVQLAKKLTIWLGAALALVLVIGCAEAYYVRVYSVHKAWRTAHQHLMAQLQVGHDGGYASLSETDLSMLPSNLAELYEQGVGLTEKQSDSFRNMLGTTTVNCQVVNAVADELRSYEPAGVAIQLREAAELQRGARLQFADDGRKLHDWQGQLAQAWEVYWPGHNLDLSFAPAQQERELAALEPSLGALQQTVSYLPQGTPRRSTYRASHHRTHITQSSVQALSDVTNARSYLVRELDKQLNLGRWDPYFKPAATSHPNSVWHSLSNLRSDGMALLRSSRTAGQAAHL